MNKLECMKTHMDGSHCGLADWYPEIEEGIAKALAEGPEFGWTTGWYASKKEIASCCITHNEGVIKVEVSVSDDFDTPGYSLQLFEHTTDLETIRETIYKTWDEAEKNQKGNRLYIGWKIITIENSDPEKEPYKAWVETYIQPADEACWMDSPPGDNYHSWGFQEEYDMPQEVKDHFQEFIMDWDGGDTVCEYEGFTLEKWED
jgi:hypothetical protein